jgi:hypothetical protein
VSDDGNVVVFLSAASNLVPNDGNNRGDVFVRNRQTGTTERVNLGRGATYWQVFDANGGIVWTVTNGAMHFYRTGPQQAVVFQSTDASVPIGVPLEAEFTIANTSSVRKRISVLIHENFFSDSSLCTFWLEANAPTRTYRMRTHTTRPWTNATLSFYAASVGSNGGNYVLDNVSTGIGWRNIIDKMHMTATLTQWYEEHGRHEIFAGGKKVPLEVPFVNDARLTAFAWPTTPKTRLRTTVRSTTRHGPKASAGSRTGNASAPFSRPSDGCTSPR